jgi:hypothetical protein
MTDRAVEDLIEELHSLRIRVSQVEAELSAQRQARPLENEQRVTLTPIGLSKGDCVRVINHIRRPAVWPSTIVWDEITKEKERNATITHIVKDQVHFITDNGTKTWRAPNNLRKIN